jgi:hypothetical protein
MPAKKEEEGSVFSVQENLCPDAKHCFCAFSWLGFNTDHHLEFLNTEPLNAEHSNFNRRT